MTISYKWLSEYLPVKPGPEHLSSILTSIGLEVESMEKYESVRGSLKGLVIGEVVSCEKHPGADKLKLTKVNTRGGELLQIICGAANVAAGQKVVVATPGTTIYPLNASPVVIKVAKIRNIESYGMICAEDEIGLSDDHRGIIVLPAELEPGMPASAYFQPYCDYIYEIGLTPNRMDAMSHLGVARDVCAYLSHHENNIISPQTPFTNVFEADSNDLPISVVLENNNACQRYSGVSIQGVTVASSPKWLQEKLRAIGVRPINNIVDITNFILHETGQPLHAFDADAITGGRVIIKNLPEGTLFTTLDDKERRLSALDLMICNTDEPMCIGGVYGGLHTGVNDTTTNIFLESAWFNPTDIRKTSFRHNLRTDAAIRFEKGVDISNTVNVLKRAALLIREIAGGKIASEIIDIYPGPKPRARVTLTFAYLRKLSGKSYDPPVVQRILEALDFRTVEQNSDQIRVDVPHSKPDIFIPADIVEEILRIDGLDNVEIPSAITITPSVTRKENFRYKEKAANYLTYSGFNEIMTNSITNSAFFPEETHPGTVKMVNSLSAGLNVMRPSMLETGLQAIAYNVNRRNYNLQFYEFGKTYSTSGPGKYHEQEHLCLYISGNRSDDSWRIKKTNADFYFMKGIISGVFQLLGLPALELKPSEAAFMNVGFEAILGDKPVLTTGIVSPGTLERFDIRQEVFFADFNWELIAANASEQKIIFDELPKQLPVHRDLSLLLPKTVSFGAVENAIHKLHLARLQSIRLFDVFESDKLGSGKKSLAIAFTFLDKDKTLNDMEIDALMEQIVHTMEKDLKAEIRK